MTKPLRVVDAIAEHDIPGIIAYHRQRSEPKGLFFLLSPLDKVRINFIPIMEL